MPRVGKAVIFDLDGVIVNSQDLYENSLRMYLENLGIDDIDYTSLIGMTTARALSYINDIHELPGTVLDLTEKFQKNYQESFKRSLNEENLIEGVKDFIVNLASANVKRD